MAIIVLASAKGGCGKTTSSILIGTELALFHGYSVALLDCDVNQHATAFAAKAKIDGFSVVPAIDESNLLASIKKARASHDVILVDLPGGSSTVALKAMQRASFVLIPSQTTLPDVKDAIKTVRQVADAEELIEGTIPRALLWTRIRAGFEANAAKHVRQSAEGKAVPIFKAAAMERTAFQEFHLTGNVPRQVNPKSKETANVAAITNELLGNLAKLKEAA